MSFVLLLVVSDPSNRRNYLNPLCRRDAEGASLMIIIIIIIISSSSSSIITTSLIIA